VERDDYRVPEVEPDSDVIRSGDGARHGRAAVRNAVHGLSRGQLCEGLGTWLYRERKTAYRFAALRHSFEIASSVAITFFPVRAMVENSGRPAVFSAARSFSIGVMFGRSHLLYWMTVGKVAGSLS
jgi:hypothetical protein